LGWVITQLVLMFAAGMISCFYGHKFFFPVISFAAFIIVSVYCLEKIGFSLKGLAIGVLCGLAAGFLVKYFHKFTKFLTGLITGALAGIIICVLIGIKSNTVKYSITALMALVLGVLAIKYAEKILILTTAYSGASAAAAPVVFLSFNAAKLSTFANGSWIHIMNNVWDYIDTTTEVRHKVIITVIMIILGTVGAWYQFRHAKASDIPE
jgi:hypothetical protein